MPRRVYLTGQVPRRRYFHGIMSLLPVMSWNLGIVVNSSCDTTRPLLRLLGLMASMFVFAFLWSGDQRIQQEIAANREKCRSTYAGPAVMQHLPVRPRMAATQIASQNPSSGVGFLDQMPGGQYQLTDEHGNLGTLVLRSRRGALPIRQSLTIQSTYGALRLTPQQSVSASSLIYR